MRRRKNNIAKTSVIFIILLLSLASISVSYAAWYDTITVDGTIETGDWYATIGDFVWYDIDEDGIQDTGELGVPDVTVNLYKDDDTLYDTTTTDASGGYLFTNVQTSCDDGCETDCYYVEFILPSGYVFTLQDQGSDDAVDSDADPDSGKTIDFCVDMFDVDLTWDAGVYQEEPVGDAGCSHGYWKQEQYFDEWTGYTTGQRLDSVFTFPTSLSTLADDTFLDALGYGGGSGIIGKAKILLRNAVASLLNAAHPDVNYPLTTSEITTQVSNALLSESESQMTNLESTLDTYNNLHNCDLCPT